MTLRELEDAFRELQDKALAVDDFYPPGADEDGQEAIDVLRSSIAEISSAVERARVIGGDREIF